MLEPPADLRAQLETWTERVGRAVAAAGHSAARRHLWSRLHGVISLELDGHLASMQLDPELIYRAELAEPGGQT
jgi:hypothetical protein